MVKQREGAEGSSEVEKCIAAIDLNNACRQFYITKVETTKKCKLETKATLTKLGSTVATSLSTLRKEMISLMDQDVSLMKQLLVLNEQVEELKSKRMHAMSKEPLVDSSQSLALSDVSDTDMFGSSSDIFIGQPKAVQSDISTSLAGKTAFLSTDCESVDSLYASGNDILKESHIDLHST